MGATKLKVKKSKRPDTVPKANRPKVLKSVDKVKTAGEKGVAIGELNVHPPVDLPRNIFCTGANYRKHVIDIMVDQNAGPPDLTKEERRKWAADMMDTRAREGSPYVFVKAVSAVTGPYDPIKIPPHVKNPDWELELAVVIGKRARHVSREDALKYVAGYAVCNDVSARDWIQRPDAAMLGADWLATKSPPTFFPFGPLLVPAAFVPNPMDLHIELKVEGKVMQNESTADMIFDIARQIEYISKHTELWPGDVIATGSPAGNGTHHNRFLKHGDTMEGSIGDLGVQRNPIIDEPV
jgi:2-keto-4-pentenoate hydratase/2-oxohepta-3-ene-1,7-dioic acid hydratase in catechol pathway